MSTATPRPSVLFVCVHNAGRSQMAAAFLTHFAGDRVEVRSAGSTPADTVNPAVVDAMKEVGIDISAETPKVLTVEAVQASDVVITMGCGDTCPVFPGSGTWIGGSTIRPGRSRRGPPDPRRDRAAHPRPGGRTGRLIERERLAVGGKGRRAHAHGLFHLPGACGDDSWFSSGRQDSTMRCDVCDHEMVKWDRPPSRWRRELWVCTWCYAVTRIGTPDHEISRPGHCPWEIRWEAAWTDMLPDAGWHAYGYFHKTLCGIEKPDMTGSQFGMWGGGHRDECPDCTAAALAIDARWPEERRDGFRVDVPAAPRPRPEDDPGYVRPVDELGRPDIRLPQTLTSPNTRVLGARPRECTPRGRIPSDRRRPCCGAPSGLLGRARNRPLPAVRRARAHFRMVSGLSP